MRKSIYLIVKRIADIIFSLTGLILLSPLFLIIAIAIKIESIGPVFFLQKRTGKNRVNFDIIKFRTMYDHTPKEKATRLLFNPAQYITKVGRFLRDTSLDELPQIWNILIGQMSFVGPRPVLWNEIDLIDERDKYSANQVMPGLTGWAQINGRDHLKFETKARLDGEYIQAMGIGMDLKCILGTIKCVLYRNDIIEGQEAAHETQKIAFQENISATKLPMPDQH